VCAYILGASDQQKQDVIYGVGTRSRMATNLLQFTAATLACSRFTQGIAAQTPPPISDPPL